MGPVESPCHIVLLVHSIGDVEVEIEVGSPEIERSNQGPNLGSVELGVVPVEIEIGGVRAPPHLVGSALIHAVVGGTALVTIDVQNGNEQEAGSL